MTGVGAEGRPGQGWRFLPEAFTSFLVLNLMTLGPRRVYLIGQSPLTLKGYAIRNAPEPYPMSCLPGMSKNSLLKKQKRV